MNTLHDMREELLRLYTQAIEKYPLTYNEENSIYIKGETLTDEEINRINYICDSINMYDADDKEDLIRLLLIYYYTINCAYYFEDLDTGYESNEDEEKDEVIELIEKSDIYEILDCIEEETIFDLIVFIIQEDIYNYVEIDADSIDDFDEYKNLDYINSKGKNIFEIYDKLHPNMEEEEKRYKLYQSYEEVVDKFSKMNIKSYFDFSQMFTMIKQYIKYDTYIEDMLNKFFYNNENNRDLISSINLYMLKYSYVKQLLENKNEKEIIKKSIVSRMQQHSTIEHETIMEFLDFDLTKFMSMINLLSKEEISELNDVVNLDNLKNYGNDGIWKRYSKEYYDDICKYNPLWLDRLKKYSDTYDIEIYYSVDKNGEYKIPRLCAFIKDNKFMSVFGRRNGLSIELDLIDILESKIKEYYYSETAKEDINTLKYIKYIENKINNNLELTNEEFEYIFGMGECYSYLVFGIHDPKIDELRIGTNVRGQIAKYYNCLESEVALSESELNEKTVVTTFFYPKKKECYYPNLKVIFCNAYGDYIESAESIPSVEYIKGDASFEKIVSSKGLENLKYIGGNAFFRELEDTSYLNKELKIMGKALFKEGYEPSNFILKK